MKAMEINVLAPDEVAETGRITYPSDMPKDITIKDDGTIATLSNSSLGKIVRQKILNVRRIINSFPSLLENSIFMLQEDEYEHEGHPARPGIENYRHYVNKFMCDGNEYYIRFTLQVHGVSQDINRAEAFLHMAELSDVVVDIAIEKAPSQLDSRSNGATKPDAYFIDKKLQYFLNPVKWETGQDGVKLFGIFTQERCVINYFSSVQEHQAILSYLKERYLLHIHVRNTSNLRTLQTL